MLLILQIILGALLIGYSGSRLVQYVDALSDRTKIGRAFLGTILLGGITSLPELTTTTTASYLGNAQLSASNLLGGVSMQTAMLAVVDGIAMRRALTFVSPSSSLMLSGVLLVFQLTLVVAFIAIGEPVAFYSVGIFSFTLMLSYLLFLFLLNHYEKQEGWVPAEIPESKVAKVKKEDTMSLGLLWCYIGLHALVVFGSGLLVIVRANEMIVQYGLNSTLVGASLVAVITSLPELATTFYAVASGRYVLAMANIFGSNALMVGMLFIADLFYREGPILNALGLESIFVAALGMAVTLIYLWGLLERRNQTIFRLGIDSFFVLTVQLLGWIAIYTTFS